MRGLSPHGYIVDFHSLRLYNTLIMREVASSKSTVIGGRLSSTEVHYDDGGASFLGIPASERQELTVADIIPPSQPVREFLRSSGFKFGCRAAAGALAVMGASAWLTGQSLDHPRDPNPDIPTCPALAGPVTNPGNTITCELPDGTLMIMPSPDPRAS